jgi:iron complex transport system permease protein
LLVILATTALVLGPAEASLGEVARVLARRLVPGAVGSGDRVLDAVVWSLRLPRVLLGATVGASLGVAGVLMQGLFRNPLAAPGIVGTSAGAALGAVLCMALGWGQRSLLVSPLAAILGALLALVLVTAIATWRGRTSSTTLLLAGVALNAFFGAMTSFVIARSLEDYEVSRRISYWTLGGVGDRGWLHVGLIAPTLLLGLVLAIWLGRDLDLMVEGDESAAALGVAVEGTRRGLLFAAAVLVGGAVATAGIVSFVGLVVPHMARLVLGPAHRPLVVASALTGAWFVVGADLVARTVTAPKDLYLGVITAFVGAPFFLFLLVRRRRDLLW